MTLETFNYPSLIALKHRHYYSDCGIYLIYTLKSTYNINGYNHGMHKFA